MAINGRALTDQQYEELRYILIKQLEGFTQTPYFDADYDPNASHDPLITIGVGFNIDGGMNNHVLDRVLSAVYPANQVAARAVKYLIQTTATVARQDLNTARNNLNAALAVLNNPTSSPAALSAARQQRDAAQQKLDAAQRVLDRDTHRRSEERRVGKECRSRWSPYH